MMKISFYFLYIHLLEPALMAKLNLVLSFSQLQDRPGLSGIYIDYPVTRPQNVESRDE